MAAFDDLYIEMRWSVILDSETRLRPAEYCAGGANDGQVEEKSVLTPMQ